MLLMLPCMVRTPQMAEVRMAKAAGVDLSPVDRHRWHHAYLSGGCAANSSRQVASSNRSGFGTDSCDATSGLSVST